MPIYSFETEEGNQIDYFFSVKEAPSIGEVISLPMIGLVRRIPTPFYCSENVNANSVESFVKKTKATDTMGDLMDRSKELSDKRAKNNGGVDPLKRKFFDDYKKTRDGKKHPEDL